MSELFDLQVKFSQMVARLLDEAASLGYQVTLGEVYRTPQQAQINASTGSGIANSLHCKRLAIDIQLFRDGTYLTRSEDYLPLGQWWEFQGGSWGGRFSRPDGNHFSLSYQGVR